MASPEAARTNLTVTPIGVGAAYARTGEIQSCYLVRAGETTLCLDLGAGALNALQAHVDPVDLDALVLSHRHPDHCADVLSLHIYLYWGPGRRRGIRVLSPAGVEERLQALGGDHGWAEVLDFQPVEDGARRAIGEATLAFAEVPHVPGTLAVRIDMDGSSIVYGADCTPNDVLVDLAKGADILIAECGDGPASNPASVHMSGGEAGAIAAQAGVGRLLLTHCFPEHDRDATLSAARAASPGVAVEWAVQGREYTAR